jgi:hypothetical protein
MSNKGPKLILAILVAVGATAALGALSRVPYQSDRSASAVLRLAWRARGVRVEECRQLTEEELANLPQHMRRSEVCEGRLLPYRLTVDVDGTTLVNTEIRPAGAREDRPLYVLQDLLLAPGPHDVSVVFFRERKVGSEAEASAATPARLEFRGEIEFAVREIALITYDAEAKELVHKGQR